MAKSWDKIKMLITNILYMNSVAFAFQLDNLKGFHKRVNDTFIKKIDKLCWFGKLGLLNKYYQMLY